MLMSDPNVAIVDRSDIDILLRETREIKETTGKVLEEYYRGYKNYAPKYSANMILPE